MTKGRFRELTCPTCGAKVERNESQCSCCGNHLILEVQHYTDTVHEKYESKKDDLSADDEKNIDIIIDFVKKRKYKEAIKLCDEMQNLNIPEIPYLKCIAFIGGNKPFLISRKQIDECIELTNESIDMGMLGNNFLLRAYIEYEYFERKFLNRSPDYRYFAERARENEIDEINKEELEILLNNKITFL